MTVLSILTLIVAKALPSINKQLSPNSFIRISAIIFMYAGVLAFNTLYVQTLGSGIGIYSGLFNITLISQLMETFIFLIGSLILMAWPNINYVINKNNSLSPPSNSIPAKAAVKRRLTKARGKRQGKRNNPNYLIYYTLSVQ